MFNKKETAELEKEILDNKNTSKDEEVKITIKNKKKKPSKNLKVKYKKNPKKYVVMASALLLMFSAVIGSSYAYLTYVAKTNNSVTITAGQLALTFQNEQNLISLTNAVPLSDSDGLAQSEEYTFEVTNNGTIPGTYTIMLESTCTPSATIDTCIPDDYIKVGIKEAGSSYKVLAKKDNKFILETGTLEANGTKSYSMKIWLDYATPNTYNAKDGAKIAYQGKLSMSYEQGKTGHSVVVYAEGGTVNTSSKSVANNASATFTVTPTNSTNDNIVSCTNGQTGTYANNTLTVTNVTDDTICTVTFDTFKTTLFNDGTLIINERGSQRSANITAHGAVANEYAPFSSTNNYVFTDASYQPWNAQNTSITNVEIGTKISPTNTKAWFMGLQNMTSGDFTNLETSRVTDMSLMFYKAGYSATTFDIGNLSNWDTSSVTSMSSMFYRAGYRATTFDIGNLSNWDTSKVTTMNTMFSEAGYRATTWNSIGTLKVYATNIYFMFYDCTKAKATLNIYSNPASGTSGYNGAFNEAATDSNALITVNYSSATTNIDNIIATKSSNSNVVKGIQLD